MCGGLPAGALPLDPVGGFVRGAARPPSQFAKVVAVAAKAASFNSLAHWASASLLPPLAALGSPPGPLLKKAGENLMENCSGFCNGLCWPAAHRERRARLVCGKAGRERVGGWIAWLVENSSGPGGAAGAHSAHKAGAGALGPRPCVGFAGLSGPQNAAAPRRNPTTPAYPRASAPPPPLGWLPGSAGRMGRTCGGRRRSGAGAFGPGPRTCPLPGLPGSGRVGVAHPPPPPRAAGFSTNAKKRSKKPGLSSNPAPPRPPPGKRW